MPRIEVVRPFKHADGIYPVEYEIGVHEVSERCAEVALQEGWAKPVETPAGMDLSRKDGSVTVVDEKEAPGAEPAAPLADSGRPSPASGPEKPSSSRPRGRRSRKSKSTS